MYTQKAGDVMDIWESSASEHVWTPELVSIYPPSKYGGGRKVKNKTSRKLKLLELQDKPFSWTGTDFIVVREVFSVIFLITAGDDFKVVKRLQDLEKTLDHGEILTRNIVDENMVRTSPEGRAEITRFKCCARDGFRYIFYVHRVIPPKLCLEVMGEKQNIFLS